MIAEDLKILLVMPLYNHGDFVFGVVSSAIATGYPVLVVDDGSTDDGLERIQNLSCDILQLHENKGKGVAILAAAGYAVERNFHAIVTIDADGQHDPAEVTKLVVEAQSGPWPAIIIGARQMVQDTVPRSSHFGRTFSNFWVRLESGRELADTQSGMRLYPAKEILELELHRSRYDFEIEVLVKAIWSGIDARSVDITVHYPPAAERVSHFDKFLDNWRLTKLHSQLMFRRFLPIPHRRLVAKEIGGENRLVARNPLQTLKNFCMESSSPFWLAIAVWMGVFLGALPLIGCHTIVIIYVAYRFHLNKLAAVAASQFCMPPLVPVLCIEIGHYLRSGHFLLDFSWDRWLLEIHQRIWEWFLGSLLLGPILGLIGALVVYWGAGRFTSGSIKNARGKEAL